MSRSRFITFVVLGTLLLLLIGSRVFKIVKIPDYQWFKSYGFESKEPYGGWMFDQMIRKHFDSIPVYYNTRDTLMHQLETQNALYIKIGKPNYFNEAAVDSLFSFIELGNDALVIGNFGRGYDDMFDIPFSTYRSVRDSILDVKFIERKDSVVYTYHNYQGDFEEEKKFYPIVYDSDYSTLIDSVASDMNLATVQSDTVLVTLAMLNDSSRVFGYANVGEGKLYLHTLPEMFSNVASKQDFYRDHFNATFGRFDPEMIILDHNSFNSFRNFSEIESPIQYILSDKSLSAAYYLLLAGCVLFVLFQSKRKQRAIPVTEKNYNTSLEYVETLSNLFASQNRPSLLVPHIRKYFFHKVKTKYYIDEKDPKFVEKLAKKSKVSEDEISVIVKMMKKTKDTYSFPKDQLLNLHKRVEQFYKNAI